MHQLNCLLGAPLHMQALLELGDAWWPLLSEAALWAPQFQDNDFNNITSATLKPRVRSAAAASCSGHSGGSIKAGIGFLHCCVHAIKPPVCRDVGDFGGYGAGGAGCHSCARRRRCTLTATLAPRPAHTALYAAVLYALKAVVVPLRRDMDGV